MILILILVGLVLVPLAIYLFIFGPTAKKKTLTRKIYLLCNRLLITLGLKSVYIYLTNRNPLVVIFYLSLLSIGVLIFLIFGYHLVSLFHKLLIPIAIFLTYYCFYIAYISDPGIIKSEKFAQNSLKFFPVSLIYPVSTNKCKTCNFTKPPRSKHCRMINKCVLKYDHYCPWIDNSIGYYNFRYFLLFILSISLLCLYCAIMVYTIFTNEIDRLGLLGMKYRDANGEQDVTFYIALLVVLQERTLLGALGLFCFVVMFIGFGFLGYQLVLIRSGMTSNESFKWDDYFYENKVKDVWEVNVYNKGFWTNFYEVLFPERILNK